MMGKGYLIVFTGIDGSGKTTQAKILFESLRKDRIEASYVWCRWEPFLLRYLMNKWKRNIRGGAGSLNRNSVMIKNKKRKLLNNPVLRWLWLCSFFIDYGLQIFVKVRIKMFKRRLVISDRMYYDAVVDQALNLGERKDLLINSMNFLWVRFFFPRPDLVIYFDCPEEIALARKRDTENVEYLIERRELYKDLSDRCGWIKIDGTLPVKEIAFTIKNIVYEKLRIQSV